MPSEKEIVKSLIAPILISTAVISIYALIVRIFVFKGK